MLYKQVESKLPLKKVILQGLHNLQLSPVREVNPAAFVITTQSPETNGV